MIILIKLIVFLVQKYTLLPNNRNNYLEIQRPLIFVSVIWSSGLKLRKIYQNSPNKSHISSGSEKIASPRFHALACK